jgi:hypothetical protein
MCVVKLVEALVGQIVLARARAHTHTHTHTHTPVLGFPKGVSIRQHTSAYVNMRQHTSAYVSIR